MTTTSRLMTLTRPWMPWMPLILFAAIAAIAVVALTRSGDDSDFVGRPRPAPVLTLPSLTGEQVTIPGNDTTQSLLLVNFWASWCAPCLAEHPVLMQMAARGVPIVGIAYKDTAADAAGYLEAAGNPYRRLGLDATGDAGVAFGIAGVPETFVIDSMGVIIHTHRGALDHSAIDRLGVLFALSDSAP